MRQLVGSNLDRERRLDRIGEILAKAVALSKLTPEVPHVQASEEEAKETDEILILVKQHHELSIGELMQMTGLSRTTAHRRLVALVAAKKLFTKGKARATRYCSADSPSRKLKTRTNNIRKKS